MSEVIRRLEVTVLTDNARPIRGDLASEWGLSLHLDTSEHAYLLDFGQSDVFVRNASVLGVDLGAVDAAFLSHAHYDHADGMGHFFKVNDRAPLYLSETCQEDAWSTKGGTSEAHFIGIRPGSLERHRQRLIPVATDRVSEVRPGVFLVPHWLGADSQRLESASAAGMLRKVGDGFVHDSFMHELTLVVRLPYGLVVMSSCSHVGLTRIVSEVRDAFVGEPIAVFMGGLHLMCANEEAVRAVAAFVREVGIATLITGHCTGDRALVILEEELGNRVASLAPGMRFIF